MDKKLFFLHIPKTAGQSVHQFLLDSFGSDVICPLRVDAQYRDTTIQVNDYQVHSGHIDWSRLSALKGSHVTFTILRKPIDRILSYYFYLRAEAKKLDQTEIALAGRAGMKAVLHLTPDEYFVTTEGAIRNFIDNHYDNFYMYYFAKKCYSGRALSKGEKKAAIFKQAITNLLSINGVYFLDDWLEVTSLLRDNFSNFTPSESEYFINKGDSLTTENRIANLYDLGATEVTFNRINDMCQYDNILYDIARELKNVDSIGT